MDIEYSPEFKRLFKKLSHELKLRALEKEKIFRINPLDSRLKTHKLSGKLAGRWAFSLDFKNRIIFSFLAKKIVRFQAVGTHDIYR
ncbi:MAG: type II toxin-antitoxin system mRNA interferase toxin, RelE/StbE family [bacterium]|nr:type II toxin-antitoxin system mRNA interferase toxin, RelE/StbE family [bacterium]